MKILLAKLKPFSPGGNDSSRQQMASQERRTSTSLTTCSHQKSNKQIISLYVNTIIYFPCKVFLLCRSWGACLPRRSQGLCQLEFWLLVGSTMLDRLWARGQTKCSTPLMLATSTVGEQTVALKIIACCSVTQTPTGQWNIDNVAV